MSAFTGSFSGDGGLGHDSPARRRGQIVSTTSVPARQSLEFWHDAVMATLVGMDISAEGGTYAATMRTDHIGDLQITTVDSDPAEVYRAPRFIDRGDGKQVFVAVMSSGIAQVEQDDRYAELRPCDVAFFETIRPFRTCFPQQFQMKIFAVPRCLLGQPEAGLSRITGRAMRPAAGLAAVLSPFMSRLADTSESYSGPVAERLAGSVVDLLAAVAAEQLGVQPAGLPGADRVLLLRVQRFIRWHLAEPGLTPAAIARAHRISVRYLHRLFEQEGTTVGRWILELRLHECRRELPVTDAQSGSVGSLARRWGFTSTAHFGRAFRREYGMSPTEWLRFERARRSVQEDWCLAAS
ncbi:helix-turn-helix domain-containing protein [Streptomyces sp. NPDC002577]